MSSIHSILVTVAVLGAVAGLACEKKRGDASDMVPPGSASATMSRAPVASSSPRPTTPTATAPLPDKPPKRPADAGPEDNVSAACPAGGDCDWACSGGKCTQICATDSHCKGSCAGGGCTQACNEGAKCEFSCSGGKCLQKCAEAIGCKKTCTGKGCT